MSVVRFQRRPQRGSSSLGKDRVIADTLDLIRSGRQFADFQDLAKKIGITPVLLNYYFEGDSRFYVKAIIGIIEGYAKRFRWLLDNQDFCDRLHFEKALTVVCEMYVVDGNLVRLYSSLHQCDPPSDCPIKLMKQILASNISSSDHKQLNSIKSQNLANAVWNTCSFASSRLSIPNYVKLASQIVRLDDTFLTQTDTATERSTINC